ncbi:MAG TPA: NUDIX hydrolase [Pseudonocardia sp.]|jgi:ADP-ribose pyrophosphatase
MTAPRTAPPRHDFAVVSSTDVYTGKVLALRRDEVRMPGGGTAAREIMEHAGAVAVAALDADDRLTMIYQYRHAVGRRLWEMPAGLLDHAGEDDVVTARRELEEEVGLAADEWSVLVDVLPSPGFSDEAVRVYLATGLHEVGRPQLDADDEEADLEIHKIALADALAMVFDGTIANSSTSAAVLAVHAVRTGAARTRPADTPWPDRPTRFAAREAGG